MPLIRRPLKDGGSGVSFFMLWHIELAFNLALCIYLALRPDGRKRFEAWLLCRFIFDAVQLVSERTGHLPLATNIWYLGVAAGTPLLLLALHESVKLDRTHRGILFAWVSLSMAAAWIRFFPYTGRAVLIIDAAAFICWIGAKIVSASKSRYVNRLGASSI